MNNNNPYSENSDARDNPYNISNNNYIRGNSDNNNQMKQNNTLQNYKYFFK